MSNTKEVSKTKVVTSKVRLSFAHIWEPTAMDADSEKKYSTAIIIPKEDVAGVKKIKAAINAALAAGIADKWGGKKPAKCKMPLRDGDEEKPDDEAYANSWFLNATSKSKPGIVDKALNPILDQDEVYSGAYVRVSLNFYAFDTKGNKGVACGLNNIQKLADGEPLAGKASAEEDFADSVADAGNDDDLLG